MTPYEVNLSDRAQEELEKIYLSRSIHLGQEQAILWFNATREAIVPQLETMPERFPISEDGCKAYPGTVVRQMLYGRDRSVYRIYFHVIQSEDDLSGTVWVMRVRHASMRPLSQKTDSPSGD